jgi:hypothetical protein
MAEKRITPQSPDKAKEAGDRTAAGVTKRSLKRAGRKVSAKRSHKQGGH